MKTIFAKSTSKFGCYAENDNEQDNHLKSETFSIDDVLNANVPLKDKAWFIRKNCEFTDTEFRQFAIGCALVVLPIYEIKYPDNKAPREAIEAAQAYLDGTIDIDVLREKTKAAYAAAAAAAYAYAAAYAAYAAAYAYAYAAAYAAYAAAYAAGNYKTQLLQFFKDFTSGKKQHIRPESA